MTTTKKILIGTGIAIGVAGLTGLIIYLIKKSKSSGGPSGGPNPNPNPTPTPPPSGSSYAVADWKVGEAVYADGSKPYYNSTGPGKAAFAIQNGTKLGTFVSRDASTQWITIATTSGNRYLGVGGGFYVIK